VWSGGRPQVVVAVGLGWFCFRCPNLRSRLRRRRSLLPPIVPPPRFRTYDGRHSLRLHQLWLSLRSPRKRNGTPTCLAHPTSHQTSCHHVHGYLGLGLINKGVSNIRQSGFVRFCGDDIWNDASGSSVDSLAVGMECSSVVCTKQSFFFFCFAAPPQ
jgi:hypothetical protein